MGITKRFVAKNGVDNNNQTITNVADPVNAQDVSTKNFSSNASNLSSGTVAAARMPALTGDVTTSAGSTSTTLATVTDSGTGSFKKISVDTKGRVTGTASVVQSDITGLLGAGSITNTMLANTAVANLSGTNTGDQTITLTGDVTGSGTGSFVTTLANSGVTAGTYKSVTVDVKGRVTSGSNPTTISGYGITDAYNKTEVDSIVQGLDPKASVKAATTANITLSGTQTIDGITVVANDRVLVKNQTTTSQNGIYVVAAGAWTRSNDTNLWSELPGAYVFVEQGTTNADTGWVCTSDQSGTLDTTAVTFVQFAGAGAVTAGTGISVTGNQVSLASGVATTGTYKSVTVDTYGRVTAGTNPTTLSGYGITDAQPLDADLTAIAGLTASDNNFIVGNGSTWVAESGATARTSLGATTVGSNFFTATNPSAITFPRVNADNSVSMLNATDFRTAIGAGTSSTTGTVTSVGLSLPAIFSVTNSPVTSSGTLTGSLANQSGATVFAGPVANTGAPSAAAPTFRNLELTDIPGSAFKKSARVATTAALTLNAATATIDGVTITASDRILIKDQANAAQNGIYYNVTTTTWARCVDADSSSEIASGVIAVDEGTANGGKLYTTTFKPTDTIGTTAMNWYEVLDSSKIASTNPANVGTTASVGTGTTLARADHVHALPTVTDSGTGSFKKVTVDSYGRVSGTAAVAASDVTGLSGFLSSSAGASLAASGSAGTGTTVARADHVHPFPTAANVGAVAENTAITAGTATKITYDAKGLVTAGTSLAASDIPDLSATYQPKNAKLTSISGLSSTATGLVKLSNGVASIDSTSYLTINQTITVSGDASGTGNTAINLTLANSGVTAGIYGSSSSIPAITVDSKGRITNVTTNSVSIPTGLTSGSTSTGFINYNGTTQATGQLDGGTSAPTGTTRLNYNGYFYATRFYGDGSQLTNLPSGGATLADDTSTNSVFYPTFASATSGAMTTANVSSTKLTFNPSTGQLNATVFNSTSDRNAKDNIKPIENALQTVKQIQGVSFTWKDTGAKSYGYIAQDIEEIVPEVVSTDAEGRKSVNYDATIAILLEAVKTLSAKVEELESKIS